MNAAVLWYGLQLLLLIIINVLVPTWCKYLHLQIGWTAFFISYKQLHAAHLVWTAWSTDRSIDKKKFCKDSPYCLATYFPFETSQLWRKRDDTKNVARLFLVSKPVLEQHRTGHLWVGKRYSDQLDNQWVPTPISWSERWTYTHTVGKRRQLDEMIIHINENCRNCISIVDCVRLDDYLDSDLGCPRLIFEIRWIDVSDSFVINCIFRADVWYQYVHNRWMNGVFFLHN